MESHETARHDEENHLSRREFLKTAGLAGASLGIAAGLGGLVAACGGEETTTTQGGGAAATTTTTQASGTTATTAPATTVSSAAEAGREIKLGFITPLTGSLANFGVPDQYCVQRWQEVVKDGLLCGDGKTHPVTFIVKDTQSDTNRAGQVAADLIFNDKVDMVMASSTANTTVPAAAQCETNGCPMISSDSPAPAWFFGLKGDPNVPFKWVYNAFWSTEPVVTTFLDFWTQVPTNKVIGLMLPNDPDAAPWRTIWPPLFEEQGFKPIDGGAFPDGLEDYTSIISLFKKEGVQIVAATMAPPDFVNFTKQSAQQGFTPVISTGGKAMLFPETAEAIGPDALGVTCEQWWSPSFPFKSSLTGESCQQLADDFTARTGRQWTQPIAHYVVFEIAADALKRATNIDDKATIAQALATFKLADSVFGPMDMSAPVVAGGLRPFPNVVATPLVGGQWVKGDKFPYEIKICSNKSDPSIAAQVQEQPLAAFQS